MNYQLVYLQYERIHRLHPTWPLSDLKGMTPRQRKHWLKMGTLRTEQRRSQAEKIIRSGGIPIG